jgi:hypothetical protein
MLIERIRHKMKLQKPYYPAYVIAVLIVLLFGIFTICQVYLLKDNYPVSKLWVGSDYAGLYATTQILMSGLSPYEKHKWLSFPDEMKQFAYLNIEKADEASWYCFPPIPAYLNYPFVYFFNINTASRVMFFLLIIAVLCAYALSTVSFESISGADRKIILLCGAIIIMLSHPFYFLIVRGHLVGIVFLLLAMGLYLFNKNNLLCCACFGLSIGMIIFPVLIFVPLLLFRRYKIIVLTLLSFALLVLVCPGLWLEFFKGPIIARFQENAPLDMVDNCSLANTCNYLLILFNKVLSTIGLQNYRAIYINEAAFLIYVLIFCSMVMADRYIQKKHGPVDQKIEIALIMMYFPFMIAIPKNSYEYNLVLLILLVPALCSLVQKLKRPMPKIILWILMTGIFLSQMQARFIQNLIKLEPDFFYFFPAFGLFLVMTGSVLFKFWLCRENTPVMLPEK